MKYELTTGTTPVDPFIGHLLDIAAEICILCEANKTAPHSNACNDCLNKIPF